MLRGTISQVQIGEWKYCQPQNLLDGGQMTFSKINYAGASLTLLHSRLR